MEETIRRVKVVEVPRCQATTTPRWYSPDGHQCPYAATVELDGEWLCHLHAKKWAKGEQINDSKSA